MFDESNNIKPRIVVTAGDVRKSIKECKEYDARALGPIEEINN